MGYKNETSAVVSAIDREKQMFFANEESASVIQKLIPILEHRKKAAEKYFLAEDYPSSQNELFKLVQYCNEELKQVLGVL